MLDLRFDNRVAIVTGAARGLGRGYALLLASRGAKVVVNDIGGNMRGDDADAGPAAQVAQEIKAAGGEAVACTDSVASPQGGKAIVEAALDHFGRVDIVIHSAGNVRRGALDEISQEDFDAVLNVHLHGTFYLVRQAFPRMKKQAYGRMVMTSSVAGVYGNLNAVNYAVSKTGVIGLSNLVAIEGAASNIKSNCILPGALTRMADGAAQLDTSKFPPTMAPEMIAPVVGYLCHESCAITGELLISMAGRVARAFIAETPGVVREKWTIENVAENLPGIRNTDNPWILPTLTGFPDHLRLTLEMAAKATRPPK